MRCLICDFTTERYYSIVAPWITEIMNLPITLSFYYSCGNCEFAFFERFPEELLNGLYANYRSDVYFKIRHLWEPWYGKKENLAFSEIDSSRPNRNVERRKANVSKIFEQSGVFLSEISGCLDFGGDKGQFIPTEIQGNKYILDPQITSSYTLNSISFVSTLDDIPDRSLGLVMSCMTLEHVNDVDKVLENMMKVLNLNGHIFLEVPMDGFKVSRLHKTEIYRNYIIRISKFKNLFRFIDFLSGIWRLFFRRIPFWGILKQSEHINYFNCQNLNFLISKFNLELIGLHIDKNERQGKVKYGSISLLCKYLNKTNCV